MRFTTLSLVLAFSATFSATSTIASPINTNNNNIPFARRHLYQNDVVNSQLANAAIDNSTPSSQLLRSPSFSSGGARMINKRQRPRRLAGDKRGTDGLLDNLVGDIVPPKPPTDASSQNGETIVKRDDGEDEDEDDTSAQEAEAGEPAPEQEVIAKEGNDDEEYITRGQDLTELVPEEITNSGSDQEPTSTTTAEESEPTSKPEDEDKEESKDKNGLDEEPTPAPIPDDTTTITEEPEPASATDASEAATTDADAVPEPTDPAVAITSSTKITDSSQDRPSGQTDLTVTKASKNEEAGPTTLPKHKEETNSNTMALTVGVIIAAIVIASVIGIWIFRKWKLFPSRQFKSKIIGGSAKKEKATAAAVYGPGNGHDDRSEYNSRDEIFRPEVYEIEPEPPMTSVTMTTPAYPAAVAGSEYEYGYAHYEKMQQQQQPMSGDTNYQPYQYGYNSGVPAMSEASEMRASVTTISNPKPNVIGGVPATGHNIHGYGSEDYTQNDHFLRELRE